MSIRAQTFAYDGRGVRIAGERWVGAEDGLVVVLLHGGGQTRHSWSRTAERLAAGGRVAVSLDLRGHGDSQWDRRKDYSLDGFVGDLLAYVRTLDRPPVLVGASLGGVTSLPAAAENPGLARALVLVDVVVRVEPQGVTRIHRFMTSHPEGFGSLSEVADAIAAYNPVRRRARNLDGVRKNVRRGADGRWRWHWDPAFMRIEDEPQRLIEPERLRAAAARLTVPTLIVRGLRSDVVSDAGIHDMLDLVPHARVVDVQEAGHMVAGDDNDVFAMRLKEFLGQVEEEQA